MVAVLFNVTYVCPNVCEIRQRGGLLERWKLAESMACQYIEIPSDLIKGKDEENRTGLSIGDFLSEEAIHELYKRDCDLPESLKYILHTEPSLVREDRYGVQNQTRLKWYDKEWVEKLVKMIISICTFFARPASIIEIHPGDTRNSYEDILESAKVLLERYAAEFKKEPLILLENRTGQFISRGKDIASFWEHVEKHPDLIDKIGIVLDIQQLFTVTKNRLLKEMDAIPTEFLVGFHIHSKHATPGTSDKIPWKQVFGKISTIQHDIIINPEVTHKKAVKDSIDFCNAMLAERVRQ